MAKGEDGKSATSENEHVITSQMPKRPGVVDRRVAVAPVRLGRAVSAQNRKGLGKPN